MINLQKYIRNYELLNPPKYKKITDKTPKSKFNGPTQQTSTNINRNRDLNSSAVDFTSFIDIRSFGGGIK